MLFLFFSSLVDLSRVTAPPPPLPPPPSPPTSPHLQVSEPTCCDYDKRTPLHLAASEGCYKVTEWLLGQGAAVNAVDRFRRTPLEEAVRGDFAEVAKLLIDKGGKIQEGGKVRLDERASERDRHGERESR